MEYRIRKNVINWIFSSKYIIGLFIGSVGYLIYLNDWVTLFRTINLPYNIFEPYIYSITDKWAVNISIAGMLFAISGISFDEKKESYCIYRTSKVSWLMEKIFYLFVSVFIYCLGIAFIMVVLSIPFSYISNQWSELMAAIAKKPIGKMFFNNTYIIYNFSPVSCGAVCWLLNFLYLLMLSFIAFGMNFFKGRTIAFSTILCFQAIQYYLTITTQTTNVLTCFKNTLFTYCIQDGVKMIFQSLVFEIVIIISVIILLLINKNKVEV